MRLTKDKIDIAIGIIVLVAVALFVVYSVRLNNDRLSTRVDGVASRGIEVILYQSSTCACCDDYENYLIEQGFTVQSVYAEDRTAIREQYHIPELMESCHTAVIEGYFVEGHVPVKAIEKLLRERPDIDGIALPGMPLGSPGMPGEQLEPMVIYALSGGESSEFVTIR